MSKKDGMDLRWKVDDLIEKFLGFSEPVLAATALNCISNGYDKKKTAGKHLFEKVFVTVAKKVCSRRVIDENKH